MTNALKNARRLASRTRLSLAAAEIPTNAASIANRLSDQLGKVLDGLESLAAKLPSEPREKCLAIARSLDDGHDELDTLANNLDVNRQSGKSPYLKYFQDGLSLAQPTAETQKLRSLLERISSTVQGVTRIASQLPRGGAELKKAVTALETAEDLITRVVQDLEG